MICPGSVLSDLILNVLHNEMGKSIRVVSNGNVEGRDLGVKGRGDSWSETNYHPIRRILLDVLGETRTCRLQNRISRVTVRIPFTWSKNESRDRKKPMVRCSNPTLTREVEIRSALIHSVSLLE